MSNTNNCAKPWRTPKHGTNFFLYLHAPRQVHPQPLMNSQLTYADSLWNEFSEQELRIIPSGMDHSAVWCIWHITRIEDVVMNILIADSPQVFDDGWFGRLGTRFVAIGNEMTPDEIVELSQSIDLANLHEYWCAVTRRTREVASAILQNLSHPDIFCASTKIVGYGDPFRKHPTSK